MLLGEDLHFTQLFIVDITGAIAVRTPPAEMVGDVEDTNIPWFQFQDLVESYSTFWKGYSQSNVAPWLINTSQVDEHAYRPRQV